MKPLEDLIRFIIVIPISIISFFLSLYVAHYVVYIFLVSLPDVPNVVKCILEQIACICASYAAVMFTVYYVAPHHKEHCFLAANVCIAAMSVYACFVVDDLAQMYYLPIACALLYTWGPIMVLFMLLKERMKKRN